MSDQLLNRLRFLSAPSGDNCIFRLSLNAIESLRQQLAERENCGDEVEIIEKYPQSVAAWRRKAEELERQLAAFNQVAEVVKNPSSQIRIVNMDGNAFDLCDNVGLKLYANNNRDDAAH